MGPFSQRFIAQLIFSYMSFMVNKLLLSMETQRPLWLNKKTYFLNTKSNASKIARFAFSNSILVCAEDTKPTSYPDGPK